MSQAKEENLDTEEFFEKKFNLDNEEITTGYNVLGRVSSSFKELSVFKGRFLKFIYDDRRDGENMYD